MPKIYSKVSELNGNEKVGSQQCVALIQEYTNVGSTKLWRPGAVVVGNPDIKKGTAIATFIDGAYPNHSHGNHAAFFLRQAPGGIYVMDQWRSQRKPTISEHFLRSMGKNADGSFKDPSNNADAYSTIESSQ